jgi:Na+-transporting NADH:ubiquinone oxidoreductase subunit C
MAKKKQILYPVVFMVLVTAFFTFLLAFINDVTKETIEEQQELTIQRSILYVFNIDITDQSDNEIKSTFSDKIESELINDVLYYTHVEAGQVKGYAVQVSGKGLWGTITGHIAFSPSHDELLGVNFTAHSETPGLGGRIDEDEFKNQFRNIPFSTNDALFEYGTSTGGNIDAISGATLTSIAVRDILNLEIPTILEQAKKEGFYESN